MAAPSPNTVLELSIGGRPYRVGVPTAEATRMAGLAARVDAILAELKASDPQIDRDRQLVFTCLQLMADLAKLENQADDQQGTVTRFHRHLAERLEVLLP